MSALCGYALRGGGACTHPVKSGQRCSAGHPTNNGTAGAGQVERSSLRAQADLHVNGPSHGMDDPPPGVAVHFTTPDSVDADMAPDEAQRLAESVERAARQYAAASAVGEEGDGVDLFIVPPGGNTPRFPAYVVERESDGTTTVTAYDDVETARGDYAELSEPYVPSED